MLKTKEEDGTNMERKEELLRRLDRVLRTADASALDIVERFVVAAETNEEVRRRRASGGADVVEEDKLVCFLGGTLDEDGADVRPADREACGEGLRGLQRRSRIQAKYWGRVLNLLEFVVGDWD